MHIYLYKTVIINFRYMYITELSIGNQINYMAMFARKFVLNSILFLEFFWVSSKFFY